jgi:hypothetical protein
MDQTQVKQTYEVFSKMVPVACIKKTQSYKFTFLITEMLEICIQTSYDQNVQLILKSYLPVVYGTPLIGK